MARQRQRQVGPGHAAAIVRDPDQRLAAPRDVHCNPPGTGVQCVFNQFLDRTRRPFHHLARRDAVHRALVKLPDHRAVSVGAVSMGPVGVDVGGVDGHATIPSMGEGIRLWAVGVAQAETVARRGARWRGGKPRPGGPDDWKRQVSPQLPRPIR